MQPVEPVVHFLHWARMACGREPQEVYSSASFWSMVTCESCIEARTPEMTEPGEKPPMRSNVTSDSRHFTASMVVIDPATQGVLLVHHNATDQWLFPGGHVDPDETPGECALREVLEETGIQAAIFDNSGIHLPGMEWHPSPWITAAIPAPVKPHKGEPAHTHIDFLFIGTADSTAPMKPQLNEVHDAQWILPGFTCGLYVRAEVPNVARLARIRLREAGVLL